ncbi:Wadjet anti-phage system protein JetD domain-containing protein [Rhizobium sp.]|uniref:Wadjet anti-phage system protein JetD domain-containing protein n=1 Tax=Rhizobium sp. TaxID=391 RepID=UPI0028AE1E36
MKHISFADAGRLLANLLDRYEAKPDVAALFGYANEAAFSSVEARDRFIETLRKAEKLGAVKIETARTSGDTTLRIRLVDVDALYRHLARMPSCHKAKTLLSDFYELPNLPETAREVIEEIGAAWSRNVRKFGIMPNDTASLKDVFLLARGLQQRANDPAAVAIDFRSFSRSVNTGSKTLDHLATSVVAIHSRLYPGQRTPENLDTDEALATFGVSRMPQPLQLSGPIAIDGVMLPPLSYYGFPPDQAATIELSHAVDYVLTIENYTSFIRHARECNASRKGLILYTAGFPARSHLRQIIRLCLETGTACYHWGDLDAGGVRIFRHIERALQAQGVQLQPHLMDAAILTQYGVAGTGRSPLPSQGGSGSAIEHLWCALRETGLVLEQESLSPCLPG